jgi:hypothetical protein
MKPGIWNYQIMVETFGELMILITNFNMGDMGQTHELSEN